ncbi:hypothetical protein ABPG75_009408 [Micractinium tetrahymenae]
MDLVTSNVYHGLASLHFQAGQYEEAVAAAVKLHDLWVKREGPNSDWAALHGILLGKALTGAGRYEDAMRWLLHGSDVAAERGRREAQVFDEVYPDGKPAAGSDLGAALQRASAAVDRTAHLLCEVSKARFYYGLSAVARNRYEWDRKWKRPQGFGAGATAVQVRGMTKGLQEMLEYLGPDHSSIACALREHGRVQAVCKGRRHVLSALLKQHKELEDMVKFARRAKPKVTASVPPAAWLHGPSS